jgi:hypothetical protein
MVHKRPSNRTDAKIFINLGLYTSFNLVVGRKILLDIMSD